MMEKTKRATVKATQIAQNNEMGQQQRLKAISKLYAGVKPQQREKVYMVSTSKASREKRRTVKGRKRGAVRMVDSRLKKDRQPASKRSKK